MMLARQGSSSFSSPPPAGASNTSRRLGINVPQHHWLNQTRQGSASLPAASESTHVPALTQDPEQSVMQQHEAGLVKVEQHFSMKSPLEDQSRRAEYAKPHGAGTGGNRPQAATVATASSSDASNESERHTLRLIAYHEAQVRLLKSKRDQQAAASNGYAQRQALQTNSMQHGVAHKANSAAQLRSAASQEQGASSIAVAASHAIRGRRPYRERTHSSQSSHAFLSLKASKQSLREAAQGALGRRFNRCVNHHVVNPRLLATEPDPAAMAYRARHSSRPRKVHGDWEQLQVLSYSNSAGVRAPRPPIYASDILDSHDSVTSVPSLRQAVSGQNARRASPAASRKPYAFSRLACFGVERCSSPETYHRTSASELTATNLKLHERGSSSGGSSSVQTANDLVGELSSVEVASLAPSIASSDWSLSSISTSLSERAGYLMRGPPSILSCIMESEPAGFMDPDHKDAMIHSANSSVASLAIWNNPVTRSSPLQRPSLTQWLDTIPCEAEEEAEEDAAGKPAAIADSASEAAATAASNAAADIMSRITLEGSIQAEPSGHSINGSEPSMHEERQDVTPGLPISMNCRMLESLHGVRTWSDNDMRSSIDVRSIAANWPPAGPAGHGRSSETPAAVPSARIQLGGRAAREKPGAHPKRGKLMQFIQKFNMFQKQAAR
ncbi:hypothetical protein WJX74_000561 [Apatococcus lobatus]|uniref:Uncharacterized protein n=1 Tax=Apatococcus lobatus TaxID=904363 RepID=A0AAW1RE76_9CHLO